MMTPREALALAIQLHAGQKDKAGRPYWEHCQRVQARLVEWNPASSILIAAALHDVLEDTGVSGLELVQFGVPRDALELIRTLTRKHGEDYDAYIMRISMDADAMTIKLADLADNLDPLRLLQLPLGERKRLYHKYNNALRVLLDIGAC